MNQSQSIINRKQIKIRITLDIAQRLNIVAAELTLSQLRPYRNILIFQAWGNPLRFLISTCMPKRELSTPLINTDQYRPILLLSNYILDDVLDWFLFLIASFDCYSKYHQKNC